MCSPNPKCPPLSALPPGKGLAGHRSFLVGKPGPSSVIVSSSLSPAAQKIPPPPGTRTAGRFPAGLSNTWETMWDQQQRCILQTQGPNQLFCPLLSAQHFRLLPQAGKKGARLVSTGSGTRSSSSAGCSCFPYSVPAVPPGGYFRADDARSWVSSPRRTYCSSICARPLHGKRGAQVVREGGAQPLAFLRDPPSILAVLLQLGAHYLERGAQLPHLILPGIGDCKIQIVRPDLLGRLGQ